MQELERIKAKIRALSEKSIENGCTEQEAMMAMDKVGELLEQYNLTMNEVLVREEQMFQGIIETGSAQKSNFLIFAIAPLSRFTETKAWFSQKYTWKLAKNGKARRHPVSVQIHFFGLESDTSMFEYLYRVIEAAYQTELAKFQNSYIYQNADRHRKSLTTDFSKGFFVRIGERLNEMHDNRVAERRKANEYAAATTTKLEASDEAYKARGTELVVIEKERRLDEELKNRGFKFGRGVSRSYRQTESFERGATGANRVNLARGVGGASKNHKQLA